MSKPGEQRLRAGLHRIRQIAIGPTADEFKADLKAQVEELLQPDPEPPPPKSTRRSELATLAARIKALEDEVAKMRASDARLIRAALTAAALLLINLLTQ
jgi:uncharacterized protein (DUF2267 family)